MKANGLIRRTAAVALCVLLAMATPACDDSNGTAKTGDGAVAARDGQKTVRGGELGAAPAADQDAAADEDTQVPDLRNGGLLQIAEGDAAPGDVAAAETPDLREQALAQAAATDDPDEAAPGDDAVNKPATGQPTPPAVVEADPPDVVVEVEAADAPKVVAPAPEDGDEQERPQGDARVAIATPRQTDPAGDEAAKPKRQVKPGPPAGQDDVSASQPPAGQEHPSFQQLAAVSPPLPSVPKVEGYESVSFDKLSGFAYYVDVPEGFDGGLGPGSADPATAPNATDPDAPSATELAKKGDDQIPAEVKALNQKKIAIVGYMVPIDFEQGKTNEFVLIRVIPSCFFCQQPMINEWIEVKTKDNKRFPYNGDDPLLVTGVLSVGAEKKDGFVTSVFRMEADNVEVVQIK